VKVLIETQYMPSVAYFTLLCHAEEVFIEVNENFEKQTYRNRCEILTSHGTQRLTVPVHSANSKIPIRNMQIDHRQKWINNHWRAIQSAYGKAPFFEYYSTYFENELKKEKKHLIELNQSLLTLCLRLLQLNVSIEFTKKFELTPAKGILDARSAVHPKKPLESMTWFQPKEYYQMFGKNFVPNLSILDLLFCVGPDALMVLKQSGVFLKNK
jgi:hypothetical protein|tara:strand:+ start:3076 stop:3711 length:636 start_codon:yes stop_codon:yes gene_type:complete